MKTAHNVMANVSGRLWQVLMSFAFIPFYIRFMGVEAYGLVGVFATMLAIFSLLDMGLSLAVNRELARLGALGSLAQSRNLVRTLELVYWTVGVLIALTIYLAAGFVAQHWLNVSRMPAGTATAAIKLMAVVALLRWPSALYTGVLMGMREHVIFNIIVVAFSTLSGAGAVLVLWLVSPSITVFFAWQIVAAAIQITLLVVTAWRKLVLPNHRATFDLSAFRAIFRFSAGVAGVTILSVVLMQLDKLVLSSTLTLTAFGYYSLAFMVGNVLSTVGLAIYSALFPSLSHAVAAYNDEEIVLLYHKCCQVMAAAVVPAGAALAFFAPDLLELYLRDKAIVGRITDLVIVFGVANTLFAIMMMPYALQLAFGWTSLSIYKNVVAVVVYIPVLIVMVNAFGAVGAAFTWLALMIGYFVFETSIMHRHLLSGEKRHWYFQDVTVPVVLGAGIVGTARLIVITLGIPPLASVVVAAASAGAAMAAIIIVSPQLRDIVQQFARRSGSSLTGLRSSP